MSNIIDINTRTVLDIPIDKVLDGSKDLNVAIVVGWKDDDFYMATTSSDIAGNLLLLELAKTLTLNAILE